MRTRRALGCSALLTTLLLAGCGTAVDGEPEPAATTTTSATTPTPEPTPTPAEPVASAELCEHVYTAAEQAAALHPDVDVMTAALDDAAGSATPEQLPVIEAMAVEVDEYADVLANDPPHVVPQPELVPGEELTASCSALGTDLADIPTPTASVEEVCHELHMIAGYQDPHEWDLYEIVDVLTGRAMTYAPPEIEHGAQAYSEQVRRDAPPEHEDDRLARLALGETCAELGLPLLQPSGGRATPPPEPAGGETPSDR